jgi:hypothetical protein
VNAGACSPGRWAAQELVLSGRVLGPGGQPVADHAVLLHRVTDEGGAKLAEGTTGADGAFTLRAAGDGPPNAVFFVAARFEGKLYVGPLLKPPFPDDGSYVVQVGVPGVGAVTDIAGGPAGAPVSAPAAAIPARPGAPFALVLLIAAITGGALLSVHGLGPSRRRRALIALAELDERGAGHEGETDSRGRRDLVLRAMDRS